MQQMSVCLTWISLCAASYLPSPRGACTAPHSPSHGHLALLHLPLLDLVVRPFCFLSDFGVS